MKFRLSEKLKYMVLGSLLTLAGFMFGNMNNNTEAQLGYETINELTVRELTVSKNLTIRSNNGDPLVIISSDRGGGKVTTYGPSGAGAASLSITEDGGRVSVLGIDGKGAASLMVNKNGGTLTTRGITGEGGVSLSNNEDGGIVAIFNPVRKVRAAFSIVDGNGVASLINRSGELRVLEP